MADTVRVVRPPAVAATVRVQRTPVDVRVQRPTAVPPAVRVSRQGPPGAGGVSQDDLYAAVLGVGRLINETVDTTNAWAGFDIDLETYRISYAVDLVEILETGVVPYIRPGDVIYDGDGNAVPVQPSLQGRVAELVVALRDKVNPPVIDLGGPNDTSGA